MHESEKWKWSRSVMSDPQRPHGPQLFQAPPSMGFSRQEYWSGLPLPSLFTQLACSKTKQTSKRANSSLSVHPLPACFGRNPVFPLLGKDANHVGAWEKALGGECWPQVTSGLETRDRTREVQDGGQAGRWGSGPSRGACRGRAAICSIWSTGPARLPCPALLPLIQPAICTFLSRKIPVSWHLTQDLRRTPEILKQQQQPPQLSTVMRSQGWVKDKEDKTRTSWTPPGGSGLLILLQQEVQLLIFVQRMSSQLREVN